MLENLGETCICTRSFGTFIEFNRNAETKHHAGNSCVNTGFKEKRRTEEVSGGASCCVIQPCRLLPGALWKSTSVTQGGGDSMISPFPRPSCLWQQAPGQFRSSTTGQLEPPRFWL